jgi:1-deoxy-D-xylulose-5-phosphate reductoisomerase
VAVEAFLDGRLTLGAVPEVIARVMEAHRAEPIESLDHVWAADAQARSVARAEVGRR